MTLACYGALEIVGVIIIIIIINDHKDNTRRCRLLSVIKYLMGVFWQTAVYGDVQ